MFLEMTPGSIKEMYIENVYTLHQSYLRQIELNIPGTPCVLFFWATLPLKPATIALKISHLAFQVFD